MFVLLMGMPAQTCDGPGTLMGGEGNCAFWGAPFGACEMSVDGQKEVYGAGRGLGFCKAVGEEEDGRRVDGIDISRDRGRDLALL